MKESSYEVVATKVSATCNSALKKICRKLGIKRYDMLQMMCDCIVRYMDDKHNLSSEMERTMSIFEHMVGWKNCFNLADYTTNPEIAEATYYLTSQGKRGTRAVHIERPFFGTWQQDVNIQRILERSICLLTPERYQRLRMLAVDNNCSSILELLDIMIDHHSKDSDVAEFRKQFEDANRSEYGKEIEYGRKTRSRHHYDIDGKGAARMFNDNE